MPKGYIEPIVYNDAWHMDLYRAIMRIYVESIFAPLFALLDGPGRSDNATMSPLAKALKNGSVRFKDGAFRGKINASISKEIKDLGGRFSRGAWRLPSPALPSALQKAILSNAAYMEYLFTQSNKLFDAMPDLVTKMVTNLDMKSLGVVGLNRVSREFKKKINKALSVYPDLGKPGKAKFKLEYTDTETKPIKEKLLSEYEDDIIPACRDFAADEIKRLRTELHDMILGGRPRGEIRDYIESRLNVSSTRAKFIARQETALMTTEFTKVQYQNAGVNKYQWITVGDHIVRRPHGKSTADHVSLDRQTYSWDNPPSADHFSTGTPCHPGEDYNCRCQARPIVEW